MGAARSGRAFVRARWRAGTRSRACRETQIRREAGSRAEAATRRSRRSRARVHHGNGLCMDLKKRSSHTHRSRALVLAAIVSCFRYCPSVMTRKSRSPPPTFISSLSFLVPPFPSAGPIPPPPPPPPPPPCDAHSITSASFLRPSSPAWLFLVFPAIRSFPFAPPPPGLLFFGLCSSIFDGVALIAAPLNLLSQVD